MADYPIIFSPQMVRALLAGRKTMTRRLAVANGRPSSWRKVKTGDRLWVRENYRVHSWSEDSELWFKYPADGTISWVDPIDGDVANDFCERVCAELDRKGVEQDDRGFYKSTAALATKPSIHMPRWGSRITLIVSGSEIERIQDISEDDAKAEGIAWCDKFEWWHSDPNRDGAGPGSTKDAASAFRGLWIQINGEDAWYDNPEVIAISFSVEKRNIDDRPAAAA